MYYGTIKIRIELGETLWPKNAHTDTLPFIASNHSSRMTSNSPDLTLFIGHCCCAMFGSKADDEDEEYQGQSSLERQKAKMAGYA